MTKHRPSLYAYFGHHKCASQWISAIIRDVCADMKLCFGKVTKQKLRAFNQNIGEFVENNALDFLAYGTAVPECVEQLGNFKGFHVVRDPRDICVSAYFSHLYSHPVGEYTSTIETLRDELKRLPKDEGLLATIKNRGQQFEDMYTWNYSHPNILEVKMENLIQSPYQGFLEIFDFLELMDETELSPGRHVLYLFKAMTNTFIIKWHRKIRLPIHFSATISKIPAAQILRIVYNHRFSKKAEGRNPGDENHKSHYRKGVVGDWVNHFQQEHIEYFKNHYNELLIKLGYENEYDW